MGAADQDHCRSELGHILQQYTEVAKHLHTLIEDERDALESPGSERLQVATEAKESCVRQMQELESERQQLCMRAGFEASQKGMQELLDWCGHSVDIGAAWQDLLRSARQSEEMNRINGAIGRSRHEQTMAALAILNGSDRSQPVYGPQGQESARYEQRALARI